MKNPCLLSLAPLLLAVSSSLPLTAAAMRVRSVTLGLAAAGGQSSEVECIGDGVYAANSTYQANLRRVAALVTAELSANPGEYYTTRAVGYWPNRLLASSFCSRRRYKDGGGPLCADCIAGAFLEVERACPYRREASFYDGNCSLQLEEIRIFGTSGIFGYYEGNNILIQIMASGLVFQAIGFAWLFFLQFQEWRSRKRVSLMNIMEGVVILHETIHELHTKKKDGIIFKIDFEKAYDKVIFRGAYWLRFWAQLQRDDIAKNTLTMLSKKVEIVALEISSGG